MMIAGCVQYPTEKQEVPDIRPQLTFVVSDNLSAAPYRVLVDNLDMGSLAEYSTGEKSLRVLSGTHVVRIELAGKVVYEERIFLGDGAVRQLRVVFR